MPLETNLGFYYHIRMKLGLFHFQLLYQVLEQIHYLHDEDELANSVLQAVANALNAEAGTIFKMQADAGLFPLASFGVSLEKLRGVPFHSSRGVAGWVVQHSQPVKVDQPAMDQRFSGGIDAVTGFKTRSILAAPILTKGQVIGVIEFLNKNGGPFTAPDLEMVSMIGREVGIAFENVRLIRDLKRMQALLDATTSSLTAGILIVDSESRLLKINPSALRILMMSDKETDLLGQPTEKFLMGYPPLVGAVQEGVASKDPIMRRDVKILTQRGERVIGYSLTPVVESNGHRLGTALLFQDITKYAK